MRFFLSFTNSPKQAVQLGKFLDELDSAYFNICVVFDLSDQTLLSQAQYHNALGKLNNRRTYFLSLRSYSKIHPLAIFVSRKFQFLEVVLGNVLGYFCREYFETMSKSKKVILDDGLIVVSIAKLLVKSNRNHEFSFYSTYAPLLDAKVTSIQSLPRLDSCNISKLQKDSQTLGVFGSPLVESGFMSVTELELLVLNAMRFHGCTSINYYMHRRENLKFKSPQIVEIYSEALDSVELVLSETVIPLKWWSIYSSAIVDLFLLNLPNLVYSFTRVESIPQMNNPYLLSEGIATLGTIYEVYINLKFQEL